MTRAQCFLSSLVALALWPGCGARTVPFGADLGDPSGTPRDGTIASDRMIVHGDIKPGPEPDFGLPGCKPPPSCRSDDECPKDQWCNPCVADPCCPQCSACAPRCVSRKTCTLTRNCPIDRYCKLPFGKCGRPTQEPQGSCELPPLGCPDIHAPVCGCDGKTYGNTCEAEQFAQNVDHQGPCEATAEAKCDGVFCAVVNDCCQCKPWRVTATQPPPPSCEMNCKQSACSARGLVDPLPYCSAGHCLLTDRGHRCKADSDCVLQNDCCRCEALHKVLTTALPSCELNCFVPTCFGQGFRQPTARCIAGTCQVREEAPNP